METELTAQNMFQAHISAMSMAIKFDHIMSKHNAFSHKNSLFFVSTWIFLTFEQNSS